MTMSSKVWTKTHSRTAYEEPFRQEADKSTWDWKQIFSTSTMGDNEGASQEFYSYTGFGYAVARGEMQGGYFEDMQELDSTTLTVVKYMLGTTLSREHEKDSRNIKGWLSKIAKAAGESHRQTRDAYVARIFNNAFDSTAQPVWDDAAWFDSHTTYSGDTVDNDLPPASFSQDNYWDLYNYLRYSMLTQKGLLQTDVPDALVFHPSLRNTVEKVFDSPGDPDSANREANTLASRKPKLIECPELDSTTPYFLLGRKMRDYLHFVEREAPQTEWEDAKVRQGRQMITWQRFMTGVTDYMCAAANPGA